MAEWVNGKVTQVKQWTDGLFSLVVNAPIDPFTAGQFASWRWRSTANGCSAPTPTSMPRRRQSGVLSGHRAGRSKLSPRLNQLQPGSDVMITKEAAGFFVLDEVPDCDTLWMLATGTAIGPYLSILQQGIGLERFNNLVLVHAARFARDLSYLPLMQQLQQRLQRQAAHPDRRQPRRGARFIDRPRTGADRGRPAEAAIGLTIDAETSHVMLLRQPTNGAGHPANAERPPPDAQAPAPQAGPHHQRTLLVTRRGSAELHRFGFRAETGYLPACRRRRPDRSSSSR